VSLQLHDIGLVVEGVAHLDNIEVEFERGRLTTVLGRTLAGKTTLMRSIAGLQRLDRGTVQVDGRDYSRLPTWQRDIAMVYQQFINYPHLNVYENVAFPLRRKNLSEETIRQRVDAVLEKVGLSAFERRRPSQLSGGQQQRVALARALARESDILLLDEPLVNLDFKLREQLRSELRSLLTQQQHTIMIYNATEPVEAMLLGDTVVVMHDGRVLQIGTPARVFDYPASRAVAQVVNDPPMSFIEGRKTDTGLELTRSVTVPLPPHLRDLANGNYRFGIRANELRLGGSTLQGRVTFSEVSGSETFLYLDAPTGPLALQIEGVHVLEEGRNVGIEIPADRLFAFELDAGERLLAAPATGAAS